MSTRDRQFKIEIEKKDSYSFGCIIFSVGERKNSLPTLNIIQPKKLRKYVLNSLKYDYTNAMVEGKNNKIKVIKRVSYGYRSFRNFKARIMLMERYKIQKGNIHSYKFAMDAAA